MTLAIKLLTIPLSAVALSLTWLLWRIVSSPPAIAIPKNDVVSESLQVLVAAVIVGVFFLWVR